MDEAAYFNRPWINNNSVHLILMKTGDGKSVISYFCTHGFFDKSTRNRLARLIIDDEKTRQLGPVYQQHGQPGRIRSFTISRDQFITWSEEIHALFPGTSKSLFYTPYCSKKTEVLLPTGEKVVRTTKVNAHGCLVNHYSHIIGTKPLRRLTENQVLPQIVPQRIHTEEEQLAVTWLGSHLDPADDVRLKWIQSHYIRQQRLSQQEYQLHQYYEDFPCLRVELGAELLQTDFNIIHPNRGDLFFDRWNITRPLLIRSLNNCNDITAADSEYLNSLPRLLEHNQDAVILYLLPYILEAPRPRLRRGEHRARLSIVEKRNFFLLHVQTAADIEAAVNNQRDILNDLNLTLQPILVLVGPILNLDSAYVYVNESVNPTIYTAQSALHALDLTFKVYFSLQCGFPKKASHIWEFIQKGLYNIDLPVGTKISIQSESILGQIEQLVAPVNENQPQN